MINSSNLHITKQLICAAAFAMSALPAFSSSNVVGPYRMNNPDRIEYSNGYCANAQEEKKFWTAIYKYADTMDDALPRISPKDERYIDGELKSGVDERYNRAIVHPLYIAREMYTNMANVKSLSNQYLQRHTRLSLAKKIEISGKVFFNLERHDLGFEDIPIFVKKLRDNDYSTTESIVYDYWAHASSLGKHLVRHMICYGERE